MVHATVNHLRQHERFSTAVVFGNGRSPDCAKVSRSSTTRRAVAPIIPMARLQQNLLTMTTFKPRKRLKNWHRKFIGPGLSLKAFARALHAHGPMTVGVFDVGDARTAGLWLHRKHAARVQQ